MEFIFRFIVGGLIVSLFAVLGDVLKPRSFAGLFAAAPSVALATLGLTILTEGKLYAAAESRSMIVGAIALFFICFHRYPAHHEIQFAHRFGINQRHPGVAALRIGHVAAIDTNERPS